ncbi:MAG: hypothetical protein NT160_09295 [Actinobacteria bacterium]|nr:hypothetical protein [Actinomycetota bacterium]
MAALVEGAAPGELANVETIAQHALEVLGLNGLGEALRRRSGLESSGF